MILPIKDMDPECVPLCIALNRIPCVWTVDSCSGHGKDPVTIWMRVEDMKALPILVLFSTWRPLLGFEWQLTLRYDFAMTGPHVVLQSQGVGEEAYRQAVVIADKVTAHCLGVGR